PGERPLGHRLPRAEQIGGLIGPDPRLEDRLRRGADEDDPVLVVMLILCDSGRYSQIVPDESMSIVRMMTTPPGRIPGRRWSWIIAATGRGTRGRIASTIASGTAFTGVDSRTPHRPFFSPSTALSP